MNYEVVERREQTITGLCARTANAAPDCAAKIGSLWGAYYGGAAGKIAGRVPGKQGEYVYALYTNYENGCQGEYDFVVGCETEKDAPVTEQLCRITIPAGQYAKFTFRGDVQKDVISFWQQIWQEELPRSFTCDFEEYTPDGDPHDMEIFIYIALQRFCQSCGMPLTEESQYGTSADGSKNSDYCSFCYQNGAFTSECTMEEMIETCAKMGEGSDGFFQDADEARRNMREWFPTLKRWKNAK